MSRPLFVALLCQLGGLLLALLPVYGGLWPVAGVLVAAPMASLMLAWCFGQPVWWRWIHALFLPLVAGALSLHLPPSLYLAAFVLAWMVFGRIDKSRVPLYLSNEAALLALEAVLPVGARFLDIGAGTGTVLAYLARRRADLQLTGVEHAWLPWLLARIRLKLQGSGACMLRQDLLHTSLGGYDVVYAFLSPAMMPDVWRKAQDEMQGGALLVSNSFEIPGAPPDQAIELNDWKGARLYLWRMP